MYMQTSKIYILTKYAQLSIFNSTF